NWLARMPLLAPAGVKISETADQAP
ncbi:MAG: hypothetical protein JWQ51_1997, partial [Tardiphaga sp.]|nr:hypothetical protein [Tardiphaga sp.]